jgi:hypothetical protein
MTAAIKVDCSYQEQQQQSGFNGASTRFMLLCLLSAVNPEVNSSLFDCRLIA